jgi:hypothetical protein
MHKKYLLAIFLLLLISNVNAQYSYDFNENCYEAYHAITSLKLDKGQLLLNQEKERNPTNNIPYLLENYIYFFKLFIGEEEAEFNKLEDLKDEIIDRLKEGDENSPYYRYCLAQVHLQWAFARLKFKEYFTATVEINKAYRLLEKNNEEYPEFLPNLINLGLLHTLIGTIPDSYNWVKKIVGIEGTISQGTEEILTVLEASIKGDIHSVYKAECLFYLSFIKLNLSTDKEKSVEYIEMIKNDQNDSTSYKNNPLLIYAMSRIYMSNGLNDQAIEILIHRPREKEFYPFYYLDYLTGLAKLQRLDKDAVGYLFSYVLNFKGANYIKAGYQKIAWYYLVNNDQEKYREFIAKTLDYGKEIVDADKQAKREAEQNTMPNYILLKSRLLFDGGYYDRAIFELTDQLSGQQLSEKDVLEQNYRIGRVYDEWGKANLAIPYYEKTIVKGYESEYYYAANSALKLGMIYERQGEDIKAISFYKQAMSMENKEYKNSIDQKAKAGINRIENK